MPKQTQSPSKPFFTSRNLPPVVVAPASPKTCPVYDFAYNDNHELIIVKTGERCPAEDIQACKPETLSELAARTPGKNSLEKLQNMAASGILTQNNQNPEDMLKGEYRDERDLPNDILEAHQMMMKGKAAARSLPSDLLAGADVDNLDAVLAALPPDRVKAYYEKMFAPKQKEEVKPNEQ
jgi:hypothetical protein